MGFDSLAGIYSSIPTDWLILGSITIFIAFDILRSGARRAVSAALALPIALMLFAAAENAVVVGDIARQFETPPLQAALIGILFVVLYVLIGRMGLTWGGEAGQTIQAALGGVALTAIATTFWVAIPPLNSLWTFGPDVQLVFGESYRFFWLIGSYAALAFVRNT